MRKLFAITLALLLALALPMGALAEGALPQRTPVTFIAVSGYSAPRAGDPVSEHMGITVPEGAHYRIAGAVWLRIDRDKLSAESLDEGDLFEADEIYHLELFFLPYSGYEFADNCSASVNSGEIVPRLSRYQGGIVVSTPYVVCGEGQTLIDSVNVLGFEAPVEEESVGEHMALRVPEGAHYSILSMAWLVGPVEEGAAAFPLMEFETGTLYTQAVILIPDRGYAFADNCRLYAEGSEFLLNPDYSYSDPGAAVIYGRSLVCGEQAYLPGDANLDGSVETDDALLTLRHALSISYLPDEALEIVDLDHDGSITTTDALYVLRLALGIIH